MTLCVLLGVQRQASTLQVLERHQEIAIMLTMLAQAAAAVEQPNNIFEIARAVGSGDSLAHGKQLATALQHMSVIWAVILLIAGITCMFSGYRFYKPITVGLATVIGAVAGYYMGKQIGAAYIVAACLALLLAVCCFPLMKYAVAIMGGLAGAFIGANLWSASAYIIFDQDHAAAFAKNYWVGALVGLIVLGMLAFILFKLYVMTFTSMSGSTIAVLGAIALALQVPAWNDTVTTNISAHPIVVPLMILVPTIIGLLLQQTSPSIAAKAKSDSATKKPATAPA